MSSQNTIEIVTANPGTIFAIIYGGCTPEDIIDAIKTVFNTKFIRTNIACCDDVSMSVINYAIQKLCTELGTSIVYVDAPNHNRSEMIFPVGVKIQL